MQDAIPVEFMLAEPVRSRPYLLAKRLMDVLVSSSLLVALAPLLGALALAVRLDSPGPILFRQERVGERGRVFTCLKFRSMRVAADTAPHRAYAAAFIQGQAGQPPTAGGGVYQLVEDERVTRVGRWLRRTSLDELPQLWNVLRGEMSLVGPRPPIPYELQFYQDTHFQRLAARPGITGLWQVSGRNTTTFEEMVALDLAYIRHPSLRQDVWILLRTLPVVLACRAA